MFVHCHEQADDTLGHTESTAWGHWGQRAGPLKYEPRHRELGVSDQHPRHWGIMWFDLAVLSPGDAIDACNGASSPPLNFFFFCCMKQRRRRHRLMLPLTGRPAEKLLPTIISSDATAAAPFWRPLVLLGGLRTDHLPITHCSCLTNHRGCVYVSELGVLGQSHPPLFIDFADVDRRSLDGRRQQCPHKPPTRPTEHGEKAPILPLWWS